MTTKLKCRLEWHVNGVTRRYEKSELHVFLRTNNRCQCGHQRWEKRGQR